MGSATIRPRKVAVWLPLVVAFALLVVPVASADANHNAQGRGTSTAYFCDGSPNVATIQFSATKSKGIMSGFVQISGTAQKNGSITPGTINASSYSLTATITF